MSVALKGFDRKSQAPRLALIAIALFCLALIAALWVSTVQRVRAEYAETIAGEMKDNANLAMAFEEYSRRTLKDVDHILKLSLGEYARQGKALRLDRLYAEGGFDPALLNFLAIFDDKGNILVGPTSSPPVNAADREYFQFHRRRFSDEMFIAQPAIGRTSGRWSIHVSRRLNKPDGSFGGVAVAAIDPTYFTDFYVKTELGEQGVVSLTGIDGVVRARKIGPRTTVGNNVSQGQVIKEQARRPIGSFLGTGTVDGVARIYSYRTMKDYPLYAVVATAQQEALAPFRQRESGYYAAAAIVSAFIAIFGIFMCVVLVRERRLLATLADSETRYRASFDQAAVGLSHTDLDGGYIRVNRKLCDLLGYTEAELLATDFRTLIHPDDRAVSEQFRRSMPADPQSAKSTVLEKRYIHRDGSIVWATVALTLVQHADGTPDYFLSVVEDITQRKRAEQEVLRLNRELESRVQSRTHELTQAVGELEAFAYSVSHDLRAPLHRISGMAELMSHKHGNEIAAEASRYLGHIVDESQRMGRMIADLLQLARVKRGEMQRQSLNLSAMAHEVLHLLVQDQPGRVVEVLVKPNLRAQGDPGLMRIALENLLGNAWKYTGKLAVARIEFAAIEKDGETVYLVRDNGIGFDMAQADNLFVAFRRLHAEKDFSGTGIGLVSVKRIVERHHGRIWIESAPGAGTTVFFTLGSIGDAAAGASLIAAHV